MMWSKLNGVPVYGCVSLYIMTVCFMAPGQSRTSLLKNSKIRQYKKRTFPNLYNCFLMHWSQSLHINQNTKIITRKGGIMDLIDLHLKTWIWKTENYVSLGRFLFFFRKRVLLDLKLVLFAFFMNPTLNSLQFFYLKEFSILPIPGFVQIT